MVEYVRTSELIHIYLFQIISTMFCLVRNAFHPMRARVKYRDKHNAGGSYFPYFNFYSL